MTVKPRLRAGLHLDAAAIRAAAETNPRLRKFVKTVAAQGEGGDRRALALLEHLARRVIDDVGDTYAGAVVARLDRIHVLRENIAAILDSVLDGHELPPGVRVETLSQYFDQLSTEMRELAVPRDGLLGDAPIKLSTQDPALHARTLLDEFHGDAPDRVGGHDSVGAHVEPDLAPVFAELSPQAKAAMRKAAELDPAALWKVVGSETEGGQARAMTALEAKAAGKMTPAELADLRAAIAALGKARSKGLQMTPARLGTALDRITDPGLRSVVAASGDVWIIQQLAVQNPAALAEAWQRYLAWAKSKGATVTPSGFRGHLYGWMTHWGRSTQAEFTAAFSLSALDAILKGPDYAPNMPGTDLVGIGHDGWVWLIDDKSHRAKSVSSVTALTDNLEKNLRDDAQEFAKGIARWRKELPGFVPDDRITDAIITMRGAADDIARIPANAPDRAARIRNVLIKHRLRLRVTSAMGEVVEVSQALADLGLKVQPTGGP